MIIFLTEIRRRPVSADGTAPANRLNPPVNFPWPRWRKRRAVSLALTLLCASWTATGSAPRRVFQIPPGDAANTLKRFCDQSGEQIVFPIDLVRGVQTNAVQGEMSAREALDRLVAHTGLVVLVDARSGALTVSRPAKGRPPQPPSPRSPAPRTSNDRDGPAPTPLSPEPNTMIPKHRTLASAVFSWLAVTFPPAAVGAQATGALPPDETIVLSPFTVNTTKDTGYVAGSSLSGGRADTPLKLTPASMSVMTREFMDDLNLIDSRQAANWMLNATPNNEQGNLTPFGSFGTNIRNAGGATPMRNYFLFYAFVDSYNTERLEFARGPNSLLFGDGSIGGMVSNFTKVAKFRRKQVELRLQGDTDGGWRSSLDAQWGNDKFALRANALVQRNQGWREGTFEDRNGLHLTATYKVGPNTQIRAEAEGLDRRGRLFATTYADNASYWNGTTVNADNSTIASPNNFGLEQFGGTGYFVYIPSLPAAGVQDWRLSYRTRGTGIPIAPDGRGDIANFPRLPSRDFNLGPNNSDFHNNFRSRAIYVDQRLTADWFAQLAWAGFDQDTGSHNTETLATDYRVDVNRVLPDGRPNPKFGVRFADADQTLQYQDNTIDEVRLLSTYKLEWKKAFDLRQRFAVIGSYRPETFEMWQRRWRRLDNTAVPNVNDVRNQLRTRYYWDEPYKYGAVTESVVPGQRFGWADVGFGSREHKTLTTVQLVSTSTFLNERLSVIAGSRHDNYKRRIRSQIGNDAVTGYTLYGGYDPSLKASRVGYEDKSEASVTKSNIGGVFFVLPWVALQANYSQNFNLPTSGANKIDGTGFSPPLGKGTDLGLKFALADNKLYATVSRYQSTQENRILGSANTTEIRRIWTNLGSTDATKTLLDYRDIESFEAKGWEAEIVANPLPNIRLNANYARPETAIIESRPGLQGYVAANLAEWTAGGNNLALAGAAQIRADITTLSNVVNGIVKGATQNNTYRQMGNIYGTYAFTRGPLKALEIGLGGNYRGERKIGSRDARLLYNSTTVTAQQTRDAAFSYLYAPSTFEASMHLSYNFKVAQKWPLHVQLNVSNLLDNEDLVYVGYNVYNVGGIGTNPLVQTRGGFYYINPRKFTLSTVLRF
jgi:outer membrane receptor protein involved in Fe transport